MIPTRVHLVDVDRTILSSYGPRGVTGGPRDRLLGLWTLHSGRLVPEAATALLALHEAFMACGADFRVTDAYRLISDQARARRAYERGEKQAYVALPGFSFHNAGRSIDYDRDVLRIPDVAEDEQLDAMWAIAVPLGWTPVIKDPDERASESWHLDLLGPWAHVRERLGYAVGAMCACLDIGQASYGDDLNRWVQAQLHRAGYDVGPVDGCIGRRTRAGLEAAGVEAGDHTGLMALTSEAYHG